MKILYTIANARYGGGEAVFAALAAGLRARGQEVVVCASPGGKFEERVRAGGARFIPVDFGPRFNPQAIRALSRVMKEEAVHLVHSQGRRVDLHAAAAAKLAGVGRKVTTVAMLVEGFDVGTLKKAAYLGLERFVEKSFDLTLVVSEDLRRTLVENHGLPSGKVEVIYNGIDLEAYNPARYARKDGPPVIGFVGRLVYQKGLEYLLRAAVQVFRENPEVRMVLAGAGPDEAPLKKLAAELGLADRCRFSGFVEDVPKALAGFDILVLPSVLEGFPLITLEAMAMGIPVVATSLPGLREQIESGREGVLVPPQDPEALAAAVLDLLSDADGAKEMGRKGRAAVEERFGQAKMIDATLAAYHRLAGGA